MLIDKADILRDKNLAYEALEKGKELLKNKYDEYNTSILHYFVANAYHSIIAFNGQDYKGSLYDSEDLNREIFHFRSSLKVFSPRTDIGIERQAQMYTNLGKSLQLAGRFAEAIEHYQKADSVKRGFSMALANQGALLKYLSHLYVGTNAEIIFSNMAKYKLVSALERWGSTDLDAAVYFRSVENSIPEYDRSLMSDILQSSPPLGDDFVSWSSREQLWLNPLVILNENYLCAGDNLDITQAVLSADRLVSLFRTWNDLIGVYSLARRDLHAFLYDTTEESHSLVIIVNKENSTAYTYRMARIKSTFSNFYSCLDKVASMLDIYFSYVAQGSMKRVYFKDIWDNKGNRHGDTIVKYFSKNPAIWALRNLSKDIFEEDSVVREVINAESRAIALCRNAVEHRGLIITDDVSPGSMYELGGVVYISQEDFVAKTIYLAKMVRNAILYFSLFVNLESQYMMTLMRATDHPYKGD